MPGERCLRWYDQVARRYLLTSMKLTVPGSPPKSRYATRKPRADGRGIRGVNTPGRHGRTVLIPGADQWAGLDPAYSSCIQPPAPVHYL